MKRVSVLFVVVMVFALVMTACSGATPTAAPEATKAPEAAAPEAVATEAVAPEATKAVEQPAADAAGSDVWKDSDYSKALLKDMAIKVDTAKFKKDGPYVIAASNQDTSNGWGLTYNVTVNAYGKDLLDKGVLSKPLIAAVTNDPNQQISDIENFISQKPDAIVVQPLSRSASPAVLKQAVDAGIVVVLCDNGVEGEDFTTRVGTNFWKAGYKSGEGLAKLMGGKGNVVVFHGAAGADSTETWGASALQALAEYPDIKIIHTEYAQWNIATAKQKMEAIMASGEQIDGIWAGGGEMALGSALAFKDANKEAPVFGMVNVPNGFLRLAKEYNYKFVGSPDPPSMSKYCLQTAVDILQGKEVTKFIQIYDLMDGSDTYDATGVKWYAPELNDDFIPPVTVDVKYYIDGGFGRK